MRTVFTAFVSAIIGGLVTALFIFVGVERIEEASGGGSGTGGDVVIREAPAPAEPATAGGSSGIPAEGAGGASVREVYTQDAPGVVSVDVVSEAGAGGGSGFVLDEQGHVVTNQHVVEGAENVSVRFADGTREQAEIVGEDPSTDVAVVQVDAPESELEPLTLGDSDALGVGDPVIAIGNPLNVGISVTTGIVSGLGRPITAPNNFTINGAVQTDAAINPGNSGGPLFDARGTVVGVNAQIASNSGGFEGVGFAVPINTVKDVVGQLIATGEVVHGYIGVQMSELGVDEISAYTGRTKDELREEYGLPENGAIVSEVTPGGPAADAGIEGAGEDGGERVIENVPAPEGDVITEVEGEPVASADDVIEVVNGLAPGDRLALTVVSPGEQPRQVEVTVGNREDA